MLIQSLFANKLGLIEKLISTSKKKDLETKSINDLLAKLPEQYSEALKRYFKTLSELKTLKRGQLTLTKAAVCINRIQIFSQN